MGILAWLGELIHPGPVGTVEFGKPQKKIRRRAVVLLRFGVALTLLILGFRYIVFEPTNNLASYWLYIVAGLSVYLLLGYFVHPKANRTNVGWLWGFFDNPFRMSDDANRWLIGAELFLLPGRFVSSSIVEFVVLLTNARTNTKSAP